MDCRLGVMMGLQKGLTLYTGLMPAQEVVARTQVDYWNPGGSQGYQRPLVQKRAKEVGEYLTQGEGVIPTSVLLSVRMEDQVFFDPWGEMEGGGQLGVLTLPHGATLWIVDGQHRVSGLKYAIDWGHAEFELYPLPVTIMEGATPLDELRLFNIVNTRQKPISKDIVDHHLALLEQQYGAELIRTWGPDTVERARASRIVDFLHTRSGPWQNAVKVPGVPGRSTGIIRHHTLVASLGPVVKDTWLAARRDEDIAELLLEYWGALKAMMSHAFVAPMDHRLQSTVGVYVLHMLFPEVVRTCQSVRDLSERCMERVLRYTQMTSTFWHRVNGDPRTRATGMGSIRGFYQDLRQRLPVPAMLNW